MDTPTSIVRKETLGLTSSRRRARRGQTLVIVLSFLMLMTVLVLVFFGSVMTESATARSGTGGVGARQLAQSAVQLVEGIISQATVPGSDTSIAWASQPGMIRTYGDGNGVASSTPLNYYKLYSASQMIVNQPDSNGFRPDGDIDPSWNSSTAFYTDLNAPVYDSANNLQYPIVDPRAQKGETYPVQGFSYSNQTASGTAVPGVNTTIGSESLAMPVQWIYVLRDGSFISPTGAGITASFDAARDNSANPIVGRIAFWTDDECAKVNLNTASEGTYWDTPVTTSGSVSDRFTNPLTATGDVGMAVFQPAQHEFQRYPGHPATTCLSEVFGFSLNGASRASLVSTMTTASPRLNDLDTPDTSGGSMLNTSLGGTQEPAAATPLKFDRLYASVDDFNFAAPTQIGAASRTVQNLGNAATQQIIEQSRFFLTTASKASELNPFSLPKVSIWPIWDDSNATRRSPLDNAILRGSTLSSLAAAGSQHRMIFVRNDCTSNSRDYNSYPRNQQLYSYLQRLTDLPIPGFGGSFSAGPKWGTADRDQVLTEIFDYIRCSNLADQTLAVADSYTPSTMVGAKTQVGQVVPIQIGTTRGFGRIITIAEVALLLKKMDDRRDPTQAGETPLASKITVTGGNGSLDFAGATFPTTCDPSSETLVEWSLFPRLLSVACGYPALANDVRIHYTSIDLTIGATHLQYANAGTGATQIPDEYDTGRLANDVGRDCVIGGNLGYQSLIEKGGNPPSPVDSQVPTGLVKITSATPLQISGTIKLQIFAPNTNTGSALQDFTFSFPATTVPVPSWVSAQTVRGGVTYTIDPNNKNQCILNYPAASIAQAQLKSGTFGASGPGPNLQDTARSLVATGTLDSGATVQGDMRMIALTPSVGVNAYQLSNVWTGLAPAATQSACTSMRAGNGISGWTQGSNAFGVGTLIANADGKNDAGAPNAASGPEIPVLSDGSKLIPPHMGADPKIPADWDNGIGLQNDGPYINRPDEGSLLANFPPDPTKQPTVPYVGAYQTLTGAGAPTTTTFSPNREISSPVTFGSLTIGADHPWQTLLFRPAYLPGYQQLQSGSTGYTHPGGSDPTIPDHLLLDFFRMPIVEPFTESDALSGMGKVNLNTQIVPFTYINRTTGLRAVMKSVMIGAISNSFNPNHKDTYYFGQGTSLFYGAVGTITTRYPIDLDNTIALLNAPAPGDTNSNRYNAYPEFNRPTYTAAAPNFFISPSQICDLPLIPSIIPNGANGNSMAGIVTSPITTLTGSNSLQTFWAANSVTGDNLLERPYSLIYPRVTTQSNTFTVHVRAQSLKQTPTSVANAQWTEGTDVVTGEYRGSFTIEKYFDPSYAVITKGDGTILADSDDATLPVDAAVRGDNNDGTTTGSGTMQHGALWRLLYSKRFGQ